METEIAVSHQQSDSITNLIIFFSRADCESPTKKITIDINAGTSKKRTYFLIFLKLSLFLVWYPEEKFILLSLFQYKPISIHNKYETAFITFKTVKTILSVMYDEKWRRNIMCQKIDLMKFHTQLPYVKK